MSLKLSVIEDLEIKKQVNPKTIPKFAIFEPIEFPIAISGFKLTTDEMLTKTSGMEVPSATTVIPRNISLKPIFFPKFEMLSINKSAPLTNKIKPIDRKNADKRNSIFIGLL